MDGLASRAQFSELLPVFVSEKDLDFCIESLSGMYEEEEILEQLDLLENTYCKLETIPELFFSHFTDDKAASFIAAEKFVRQELLEFSAEHPGTGCDAVFDELQVFVDRDKKEKGEDIAAYGIICTRKVRGDYKFKHATGSFFSSDVQDYDLAVTHAIEHFGRIPIEKPTFEIPIQIEPKADSPSVIHDNHYVNNAEKILNFSRQFRRAHRKNKANKGLVTPGRATIGTLWKFQPIVNYLLTFMTNVTTILIAGCGYNSHTGMIMSIRKAFPKADIHIYDPQLKNEPIFDPKIHAHHALHQPKLDRNKYDLAFTDVSIGNQSSFDPIHTAKYAFELITSGIARVNVYKDHIRHITQRRCNQVFFGRGHNHECFIVNKGHDTKFVSKDQAYDLLIRKEKCDRARNFKILTGIDPVEDDALPPIVPRLRESDLVSRKRWSKSKLAVDGVPVTSCLLHIAESTVDDPKVQLIANVLDSIVLNGPDGSIEGLGVLIKRIRNGIRAASNKRHHASTNHKTNTKHDDEMREVLNI